MSLKLSELLVKHPVWIFDCDGVILDSNKIKTRAFHTCTAKTYGEQAANQLVDYHVKNGGISRFKKFEWFLTTLLHKEFDQEEHQELCEAYGHTVRDQLLTAPYTAGFLSVLNELVEKNIQRYVVSGGFQEELQDVFTQRKIASKFQGIFGSPRDKRTILDDLKKDGVSLEDGIFWGDAKADFEASSRESMRFVFVRHYSEALAWFRAQVNPPLESIETFAELLGS